MNAPIVRADAKALEPTSSATRRSQIVSYMRATAPLAAVATDQSRTEEFTP
jgi:hypothetical protein